MLRLRLKRVDLVMKVNLLTFLNRVRNMKQTRSKSVGAKITVLPQQRIGMAAGLSQAYPSSKSDKSFKLHINQPLMSEKELIVKKPLKHKNGFLFKQSITEIVVVLLFCIVSTAPAQTSLPAEDIAEKALAATVRLQMMNKHGKTLGIASGFFIQTNLIATNYHVIVDAAKTTAKLVGKDTTYNIEGVIAIDIENDLALLKVTADGIKPLSLGDSDTVQIGETVYAAGNPMGLEGTFSDGLISRRNKDIIQMTVPISPGSSGGPVLNKKGEVIAISFAGHEDFDAQNINFAIPSKYIKKLLEQLKSDNPSNPSVIRHPISAETYFQWGYAAHSSGNYFDALIYYTIAIRYKNDYAEVYNNRGASYSAAGLPTYAISDYNTAIALKPSLAEPYYGRGNAKFELKQYTAAISDFDTAIALKPNYAHAYNNRGQAKVYLKQYTAAISDFDTAIALKPNYAHAYNNRGNAKVYLKQYTAAISDFDTAIALKPDDTEAYCGRGIAKTRLKQYTAAFEDFDTAIALKPSLAEPYYYRGLAKAFLEQYAAAISDYDTAIVLKPDYARAYFQRGLAKILLDRTQDANQDLRTALELAIKSGDAALKTEVEDFLRKHFK